MTDVARASDAPRLVSARDHELAAHRREITGYCYRMLGSLHDAEDAVQEVMVRAWRGTDRFDGRSSLRTWLYRIATNVCLDDLAARPRRALPVDLSPHPSPPVVESLGRPRPQGTWIEPAPDEAVGACATADPAEAAVLRESVRLAFVAALQHLPPRQRAVLVLRDVLRWRAAEVADLLGTTTAAVNSAHQRARAGIGQADRDAVPEPLQEPDTELLGRYVAAFEAYDMSALVTLLHEDAVQSMPPYDLWLSGRDDIIAWFTGPGHQCRGSRLAPLAVNGCPGFAQWRPSGPGGRYEPWGIHVLEVRAGLVARMTVFLDTTLFPRFGLGPQPPG